MKKTGIHRYSIFISSVQKELILERQRLKEYIFSDPLLKVFVSEVFLFEDLPARDQKADQVYLQQVDQCDLYVGLFANEYGHEDSDGFSPTEREFDRATEMGKTRIRRRRWDPTSQNGTVDPQGRVPAHSTQV